MPAPKKISPGQMELLVKFAETHPDIALGRSPAGPLSGHVTRLASESITKKLNAKGDGSTKTPDQWRRYWIEFKARTKTKAADSRRVASSTGRRTNKLIPLNKIEERVLALLRRVAVQRLQGVRIPVEALDHSLEPSPSTSTANEPIPVSPEPFQEEEWLDESPPPLKIQPQIPSTPEPINPAPPQEAASSPNPVDEVGDHIKEEQTESSQEENMPENPEQSTYERQPRRSSRFRRMRTVRQVMRDERVPRWAYELESRHISVQEKIVDLLKEHNEMNARMVGILEEFNRNFKGLRNDLRFHIGLSPM